MSETTHDGAVAVGRLPAPSADDGLSPSQLAAKYGLTVSGARPPLLEYTRQLWGRRHFINEFAKARTAAQYTQARLGQLWQVVTPLLNAAVYYLIFGMLIGTSEGIDNFVAYLVTGIFIFTFTQNSVMSGVRAVSSNLGLIRALHFPRASMPIAFTLMQLQQLMMSMFVLVAIVLMTGEVPNRNWALMAPILFTQWVFNTGLSMILARLGSKMTDLAQLMPFILRTWMYASGVMYSIANLTATAPHWVRMILDINPGAVYIDLMRYALISSVTTQELPPHVWISAVGWALLVGVGGYVYFWKAEEQYGRG